MFKPRYLAKEIEREPIWEVPKIADLRSSRYWIHIKLTDFTQKTMSSRFPKKLYQGRTSLLILMEIWGRPEPSAISSWWCILISVPCFFCSSNLCLVYPDCLWVVPHPMWSLAQILKNIQWAKQLFMQLQTPRVGISNHIHPQISHSFYHLHVQKEQKPIKMGGFQASSRIFVGENIPCLPGSNHLQRPRVDVRSWPRNPWVIHIYGRNEVNPIMNINEHHIDII